MGVILAVFALATVGALVYLQAKLGEIETASRAEVEVAVLPPGAEPLFNGTLVLENATAFSALARASEVGRFAVETEDYPNGLYVSSIGGIAAEGASGWVYVVERAGTLVSGDRASDAFGLRDGERVEWRWSDGRQPIP